MLLKGGQRRPPLRNSDYINTNATGLSSSEEGLFLTLVHRIFLNMSLYIHWKHGIIKTDEPRTLDFSGVRGFLVTNVYIVQRSAA